MYVPDETVLQLYKIAGEIPAKYGATSYVLLAQVISNNEKSKKEKGEKKDGSDVSTVSK